MYKNCRHLIKKQKQTQQITTILIKFKIETENMKIKNEFKFNKNYNRISIY